VKEIERVGIPTAHITAISLLSKQTGANRVIAGDQIPYPCGDPNLPEESDRAVRKEIVKTALTALQKDIIEPTIFKPVVVVTKG
jgi:glycine reductase